MEATNYKSIGPVLQLNKAGELIQKRMKAVKVCDGLYVTEPDKSGYTQFICELNGVVWLDCKAAENRIADGIKLMPDYFDKIKAGCFDGENIQEFKREISRRINHPDSPAIMELKKPERKKPAPLAENERKVSVLMFKGCADETTEKKVAITEVAPHVYTYAYKMRRYGERVKIIFEIDGVYFQGSDNGAHIMEREDFTEVCTKAYEHARENVADGAAKGMAYLIEVQKRIDAAEPEETQTADKDAALTLPEEDINYMFYIKPKEAKRFTTYNPCKGTMDTGRVFTELYRKEHLQKVCKWIAEDSSGDFAYQLRSGDGKKIYWEHNPIDAVQAAETPQISTEAAETVNVSAEEEKEAERAKYRISRFGGYKIIVGDREQGKVTAVLMSVNGHNIIEVNDETAHIATMGEKTLEIDKPIMQLSDAEVLELIYNHTEPPQSPETPQVKECTADTPKARETARKPQNRGIGNTRHARLGANGYAMLDNASATLTAMSVPRECSTADTVYW